MALIKRTVADSWTYRRLIYLLSAVPLGPLWFTALVTLWALSFGLAITPLGILVWIVLGFATRGAAALWTLHVDELRHPAEWRAPRQRDVNVLRQ